MVTSLNVLDGVTHCDDDPRTFMAQDEGQWQRKELLDDCHICVADACGGEFDQHFVRPGRI
jgi:hypothetical protein